jgi:hypothetical protein
MPAPVRELLARAREASEKENTSTSKIAQPIKDFLVPIIYLQNLQGDSGKSELQVIKSVYLRHLLLVNAPRRLATTIKSPWRVSRLNIRTNRV